MTKSERQERIAYLSAYRWLVVDIDVGVMRLEQMTDRMYSIRVPSLSDMPRGGRARTMDSIVADKIDLESSLSDDTKRSIELKREIENAISSMTNVRDRTILRLKFINGLTHEQIAECIGYSLTQTRLYYETALENFEIPTHSDT